MSNSARIIDRSGMSSKQLILKILSGAYSGAELLLENSEYTLGSALDSDISIEDVSLAPAHFKITLQDDGADSKAISLEVLSNILPVYHNGRKIEGSSAQLRSCDRIQVGDFVFGIGPSEGMWIPYEQVLERDQEEEEAVNAPTIHPEAPAEEESEQQEGVNTDNTELQLHESNIESNNEEREISNIEQYPINDDRNVSSTGKRVGLIAALIVFFGLSLMLMFAILFYEPLDSDAQQQPAPPMVNSSALSNTSTYADPSGINTMTAHQQNSMTHSNVTGAHGVKPSADEMVVANKAIESIQSLFHAFKLSNLVVEHGGEPSTLVIRGYTYQVEAWKKVKNLIDRDVTSVKQVLDYVETPWKRKKQLEQMLIDSGLQEESQVYMTEKGLLVKTSLSLQDEDKWQAVRKLYNDLYDNNPPIFRVKDTAPWLDIKSISFGYEPYLVTSDGAKYLIGSQIKNGYIVHKITPEGVVLKNNEQIKNLPLP